MSPARARGHRVGEEVANIVAVDEERVPLDEGVG